MADYGIFRTNDAKRIAAATRRVEGTPRSYLKVPEQISRRYGGSSAAPDADGFPPGTPSRGCPCEQCFEGLTIPDATQCCESHPRFKMINPWTLNGFNPVLILKYAGNDTWVSEAFDGTVCNLDGSANEYQWVLSVSVSGITTLTLTLVTDNGCPLQCLVYWRDSFDCKCTNTLSIKKPHGTYGGIFYSQISCYVCIEPLHPLHGITESDEICSPCQNLPIAWTVSMSGFANGSFCDASDACDALNGTFTLYPQHAICGGNVVSCLWISDCIPVTLTGCNCVGGGDTGGRAFRLSLNRANGWQFAITVLDLGGDSECCFKPGTACKVLSGSSGLGPDEGCPDTFTIDLEASPFGSDLCDGPVTVEVTAVGDAGDVLIPSSTGVCDETCNTPTAPTNPDGYCCFQGQCYDLWDAALCGDFGGFWNAGGTCGESTCENEFACCVGGACIDTTAYKCFLLGGTVAIGACEDDVCEKGACCDASDGTCSLTAEADCPSPNYFWGPNTDCDPDPCPGVGACCQNDDDQGLNCGGGVDCECVLSLEVDCIGTYAGDGTNCTGASGCDCRAAVCDFL